MTNAIQEVSGSRREKPKPDVLFWLAVLYLLTFYVQPGGRVPALGTVRFELILGTTIVLAVLLTRGRRILTTEKVNGAAAVFSVAVCLSFVGAVMSHTVTDAMPVFIRLVKFFCIYLMVLGTVDSEDKLEKFAWTYVFAMLIIVGEPFMLSLRGENMIAKEDGVIRLYGIGQFAHPNGLGTLAAMNLAFLYHFFRHYRSKLIRAFLLVFGLISLRVIMLTGSRTAYVGFIALAVALWLFSEHKLKFIVVAVLVAMIAVPFIPDMYMDRFISLKEVTEVVSSEERVHTSIGGRWHLFKTGWKVFLDYPVFGCGLDSFRHAAHKYGINASTHNLLMQTLSNTGIVGFAAFSYLVFILFRTLRVTQRALVSLGKEGGFAYCLISTLLVFLFAQLAAGLVAQNTLYSNCWWIVAGLSLTASRIVAGMSPVVEHEGGSGREPRLMARRPVRDVWNMVSRSHE